MEVVELEGHRHTGLVLEMPILSGYDRCNFEHRVVKFRFTLCEEGR